MKSVFAKRSLQALAVSAVLLLTAALSFAAEIRLSGNPVSCQGPLVLLGEIAEIVPESDEDLKKLRETVLFAAPEAGRQRSLSLIQLRNILSGLGFSSTKYRLTGATGIVLLGPQDQQFVNKDETNGIRTAPSGSPVARGRTQPVTPKFARLLESQLTEAISIYLDHKVTDKDPLATQSVWKIDLDLSMEQARLLGTAGQIQEISGGQEPFVGLQTFQLHMQRTDPATGKPMIVTVEAEVAVKQQVVVLNRSLPRGYVISRSDLTLEHVDQVQGEDFFVDPEELVGMETTGSIRERSVLAPKMIKMPVWVRKGDIVTVRSVNGGIFVRTNALALQDGARGDTIPVETLDRDPKVRGQRNKQDGKTYLVRVCEPKTVEVNAAPLAVEMNDR